MKRIYFILILFLFLPNITRGQLGNRYFHGDTLNATTTARDCTWADVWQVVSIYAGGVDIWVKIGAPDVGNWASRRFLFIEEGQVLTIGPSPNLKKLTWKTDAGTGVVYVLGYKKAVQSWSLLLDEEKYHEMVLASFYNMPNWLFNHFSRSSQLRASKGNR